MIFFDSFKQKELNLLKALENEKQNSEKLLQQQRKLEDRLKVMSFII